MIHHPKHPGHLIKSLCLEPLHLSVTDAAKALKVSRPMLSKLINGHMGISPEIAGRLSIVFNTSDELWMNLQAQYDLTKRRSRIMKEHNEQPEKVWIIQRAINAYNNEYEDWPEYDEPMTHDEMLKALKHCEDTWPYEFRGHRI